MSTLMQLMMASRRPLTLQYLIIAGGGGGGMGGNGYSGGGGGAGGYIEGSLEEVYRNDFTITIGNGGAPGSTSVKGTSGGNSILTNSDWFTATALGGGGGGSLNTNGGLSGGSGGGTHYSGTGGLGLQDNQTGYSLGFGNNGAVSGGGGAGSNASGHTPGAGKASLITGSSVTYASGGPGNGGAYVDGWYGRGGQSTTGAGSAGNAGIIILRSSMYARSYTGSPTITTYNGEYIYSFTGNGSISF